MKMVIELTSLMAYQTNSCPSGELQINQLQLLQSDSLWEYPHMGYTQPSQRLVLPPFADLTRSFPVVTDLAMYSWHPKPWPPTRYVRHGQA